MSNPQIPAVASTPVPPPAWNAQFFYPNGFLTAVGLRFLQDLWAGVYGSQGVVGATDDAFLFSTSTSLPQQFVAAQQSQAPVPEPLASVIPRQVSGSAVLWTPSLAGSGVAGVQTYSMQAGLFVEVGPLIVAEFAITLTALDAATAGNVLITGLPFLSNSGTNTVAGVSWARWGGITLAAGDTALTGRLLNGEQVIRINQSGSTLATAPLDAVAGLSATSDFAGSIAYLR